MCAGMKEVSRRRADYISLVFLGEIIASIYAVSSSIKPVFKQMRFQWPSEETLD